MRLPINTLLEWVESPSAVEAEAELVPTKVHNPQILRVLWSDSTNETVAVIRIYDASDRPKFYGRFDDGTWPEIRAVTDLLEEIGEGRLQVLVHDPTSSLFLHREEDIKQRDRDRRDRAYVAIAPMLETVGLPGLINSKVCWAALVKASAEVRLTEKILRRYLRRYWQGGQSLNALLPLFARCGAKGTSRSKPEGRKRGRRRDVDKAGQEPAGVNLGPEDHRKFRLGLKAFYLQGKGKDYTLKVAHEKTLARFYRLGDRVVGKVFTPVLPAAERLPSLGQFRAFYYKNRNLLGVLTHRYGPRKFQLSHRAVLGSSDDLGRYGPGSCYQIDSTLVDIYLVSSLDRSRIIGRPILYLIVDVFSRLIVGFAVTLEAPSYTAAMLALENAATDKVAYCQSLDIQISEEEWPSAHLCNGLLADRGELAGQFPDHLVCNLGMRMVNTAPYRPDWKGIVEIRFKLVNDGAIKWLPGAVHPQRKRGERDYALDAIFTLREFRQIMVHFILGHNRERLDGYNLDGFQIADQVEPRPCELWQYGIVHRSGSLHTLDKSSLQLYLLPTTKGKVTSRGIEINGSRYTCPTAQREGWFLRANRRRPTWEVDVSFHPHHRTIAFLRRGPNLEACTLINVEDRFSSCDMEEVISFFDRQKEVKAGTLTADRQARVDRRAQVEAIEKQAQKNTEQARANIGPQSKSARRSGLRAARATEREHERHHREEELLSSSTSIASESLVDNIVAFPQVVNDTVAESSSSTSPPPAPPQTSYVAPASYLDILKERRRQRQQSFTEQSDV